MASIYVYDSNQWGVFGLAYDHRLQVGSVADMVEKALKITRGERYRSQLILAGEGGVCYQSVGAGANRDTNGDRAIRLNGLGEVMGSAAVWLPKLAGQIDSLHMLGIDDLDELSVELMIEVARLLGAGTTVYGRNTVFKYYGDRTAPVRRPTAEATVDREALRRRLASY